MLIFQIIRKSDPRRTMFWFSLKEIRKRKNSVLTLFTILEHVAFFSSEVNETAEVAMSKRVEF